MFDAADMGHMQQALALAEKGLWTTTPNPRVGCVLVREGQVVGEGWHAKAGGPHAEVVALEQAAERARGATAFITLEPCAHIGRTGPCTEALIRAGVSMVVVATEDPNPRVSGRGLARLREAGLGVRVGLLSEQAQALNAGFFKRMRTGLPWIRIKSAASLDGRTALANGQSKWITDAACRADGHAWRARSCAVLTGAGTFAQDEPLLNVREVHTDRQPLRVLLDGRFVADPDAPFFRLPGAVLLTGQALDAPAA
ncbi:MAG: bifunctional diaminohydroxyphosphoribosylaminopyrimidine deaminase/5-amino-6-(5-phosphoribosylamino)uracil reductase RibD, partial [Burkholderiaceae bacterium]